MTTHGWAPGIDRGRLEQRARMRASIRAFFSARDVLEVDTPVLGRDTATDPHLASLSLAWQSRQWFLQTSPEFFMKRLLAAGSGPIYQMGPVFRADEVGRFHNPEFTLLEWYRPGWTLEALMAETQALVECVYSALDAQRPLTMRVCRYREAFRAVTGLDPMTCSDDALEQCVRERVSGAPAHWDRDGWLNLLMACCVEPSLGEGGVFLMDFPPSQAALAAVVADDDGVPVARRAELYLWGVEIANGYQELTDAAEQARRFQHDLAMRRQQGLPSLPMPDALLQALQAGIPACAGIALGVDRLMMALLDLPSLENVLPFDGSRC